MKTFFEILFVSFALYLLYFAHKREKVGKENAKVFLEDLMEKSIEYQFTRNNPEIKKVDFTDEEVDYLSNLIGVKIPRPDPFRLKSFLGTTLDKKHIPNMKYHHICVKMHKYSWKGKEYVCFDIELHNGEPVMKGNELTHPFYAGSLSFWPEMKEIENKWSNFVMSLEDIDHKKTLAEISKIK